MTSFGLEGRGRNGRTGFGPGTGEGWRPLAAAVAAACLSVASPAWTAPGAREEPARFAAVAAEEEGARRTGGWWGMERLRRWWLGEEGGRPPAPNAAWRLSDLLAGEAPGFARAEGPRPFAFPRDHGPHEGFRTEWWYFTGHLRASDGIGKAAREFGYQLTFFRFGLVPPGESAGPSRWAARHVYMAHFAVADVAAGVFRAYERLGRGALGIAGSAPGRVWIDEWSLAGPPWPLRLRAGGPEYGIDLRLAEGKPIVLQGDRGFSRKSDRAASYYYSAPRMPTAGQVRVGGAQYEVRGESWWDREWGSGTLAPDQAGWDWFALQLDGARELMVYRLRRKDGSTDPHSAGVWVGADGGTRLLGASDFSIEVRDEWRSPRTGAVYPARWRVRVPALDLGLDLVPRLPDQELALSIRYWEGAVSAAGAIAGEPAAGLGYVELTGYADGVPAGR